MSIRERTSSFFGALTQRKSMYCDPSESKLKRCLTTVDLIALGIGSTLGLGIYVLAGQVASVKAGPAVILSFFIAGVASVFSGLCYAEFGARVPMAGSAYVYSYVTVGELMAFIIGWNLILEYIIGTASVARGYSGYLDSIFNNTIERTLTEYVPMPVEGISKYPDFLAFSITIFLTVMLCIGVKESTYFNNVFTGLNLLVVLFSVIAGSIKSDVKNWKIPEKEVPSGYGKGGFFPYGLSGMMEGAATCFYAFVGFDIIATTGEEVKNPQRSIPLGIVVSLCCTFLAYFGVSAVQTLMWPYYDQDNSAPLPYVFNSVGWPVAKWIVSIGALAALSTSLLGAMFPLPRILYAMASDGVIFKSLARVHDRFQTPLLATFLSGTFAALMAMLFDVSELADMMSIGTLLAYSLVALSVLVIRYSESEDMECNEGQMGNGYIHDSNFKKEMSKQKEGSVESSTDYGSDYFKAAVRQIVNYDKVKTPTPLSTVVSRYLIIAISFIIVIVDALLVAMETFSDLFNYIAALCCVFAILLLTGIILLYKQPVDNKKIAFKVPFVPIIPFISVFVNVYLMCKLPKPTWIRFAIWLIVGFLIYFCYGMRHSKITVEKESKSETKEISISLVQPNQIILSDMSSEISNGKPNSALSHSDSTVTKQNINNSQTNHIAPNSTSEIHNGKHKQDSKSSTQIDTNRSTETKNSTEKSRTSV